MVNGPRPAQLAAPAAAILGAGPRTASTATPSRSPLLLQRQATSMYSTCSTETPVLVYGKTATPLVGAWSAEPFEAVDLGEQLEHHDHHDDATVEHADEHHDDVSSVAETAAPHHDAASTATNSPTTTTTRQNSGRRHVAVVYRHDPYAPAHTRHETYRCECDRCYEARNSGVVGTDVLVSGSYDAQLFHNHAAGMQDMPSEQYSAEYDDGMSTTSAGMMYGEDASATWTSSAAPAVVDAPPQQQSSAFMPPPPPPKIMRGVMAESAEDSLDVDAAFYHIAMRWYNKVVAVQANFVAEEDACPKPSTDIPFDEWVANAGKWWLRNFEHRQIKTTPSSGMLRTAVAPAHARASEPAAPAPVPRQQQAAPLFETHTTVSESYANHRTALRTGPRKVRGSSGLTAGMLSSLGNEPMLPQPRSAARDLPW